MVSLREGGSSLMLFGLGVWGVGFGRLGRAFTVDG